MFELMALERIVLDLDESIIEDNILQSLPDCWILVLLGWDKKILDPHGWANYRAEEII